jgi:hypothetical protein
VGGPTEVPDAPRHADAYASANTNANSNPYAYPHTYPYTDINSSTASKNVLAVFCHGL